MNSINSQIILVLGAAFLLSAITLCTLQNIIYASPESDYELSLLPLNDFERSQVITVGNPEPQTTPVPQFVTTTVSTPITVISTQQIEIDNNDYILITYSNGSTQIMPIDQFNDTTEIHVSVEDSNDNHDHKTHHHDNNKWTQQDFINKYGSSLPDDGKISDDDNGNIQHPNISTDHITEVKSTPSTIQVIIIMIQTTAIQMTQMVILLTLVVILMTLVIQDHPVILEAIQVVHQIQDQMIAAVVIK